MTAPRYDVRALMAAGRYATTRDLAEAIGLPVRTVRNGAKRGLLEATADEWACACDLHAEEVWPDWGKIPCGDPKCPETFTPKWTGQKYHELACGQRYRGREYARRRYHNDPEYAARDRARSAEYKAVNARAVAIKVAAQRERTREQRAKWQRDYYRRNRDRILAQQAERDRVKRVERERAKRRGKIAA